MTNLPFTGRDSITDSYETEETFDFIGGGAFAQVYAGTALQDGEHVREGQKVALKVVSKKNLTTDKKRKDIINEVEILGLLNNDHCARLVEAFQTPFQAVIVMDLVEGKELMQVMSATTLTESMVHSVMMQLLDALQYLHSTVKVVHRDVKPENIMLTPKADGSFHVTLVDFGLARPIGDPRRRLAGLAAYQRMMNADQRLGRNASIESLDQQDSPFLATPCGTMGYLAPETLRGLNQSAFHTTKALLPRSDVYSAGIIMYLMLCGDVPFHGHDNRQALHKQMENGPSFDGPRWEHISPEAKQATALMLHADPASRPSLDEVALLPWFNGNAPLNEQSCAQVDEPLLKREYEVSVFGAMRPPEYMMNEEEEEQAGGGTATGTTGRCVTVPFGNRQGATNYF